MQVGFKPVKVSASKGDWFNDDFFSWCVCNKK